MLSPCRCDGSVRCTHQSCLIRWISERGSWSCELCYFKYQVLAISTKNPLQVHQDGVLKLTSTSFWHKGQAIGRNGSVTMRVKSKLSRWRTQIEIRLPVTFMPTIHFRDSVVSKIWHVNSWCGTQTVMEKNRREKGSASRRRWTDAMFPPVVRYQCNIYRKQLNLSVKTGFIPDMCQAAGTE